MWSRRLPKSIVLRDGREIKTLADARAFIFALPERRQASRRWEYASRLLAAAKDDVYFVKQFAAQLKRALKAEGLI